MTFDERVVSHRVARVPIAAVGHEDTGAMPKVDNVLPPELTFDVVALFAHSQEM